MIKLNGAAMHATDFLVNLFERSVVEGRLLARNMGQEIKNLEDLDCEIYQRKETMAELTRSFFRLTPDYLVENTSQSNRLEMTLWHHPFCGFSKANYVLGLNRLNNRDYSTLIAVTIPKKSELGEDLVISMVFSMIVDWQPGGIFLVDEPRFNTTGLMESQLKWIQKWVDRITKVVNKKAKPTRETNDD